jgi:DNA transformation protein
MASDKSVLDEFTARLTPMGPVTGRRMFGGFGIFMEGLMFGLIAHDILYFKVDDGNRADFEAAGSQPFSYQGKSKPVRMSYWKVPEQILADSAALIDWGENAHAAARRAKRK